MVRMEEVDNSSHELGTNPRPAFLSEARSRANSKTIWLKISALSQLISRHAFTHLDASSYHVPFTFATISAVLSATSYSPCTQLPVRQRDLEDHHILSIWIQMEAV